ncbi:MAG: hypothetical protein ACRDRK_03410 [Pseudonocardia sp.]
MTAMGERWAEFAQDWADLLDHLDSTGRPCALAPIAYVLEVLDSPARRLRWHATQALRVLRHPHAHHQMRIRCNSMAGWVVEHLEARSDVYAAARRGRRAAVWLCLLSGLHPRHGDQVAGLVLDRWHTTAALWTVAELRAAIHDGGVR